MIKVWKLGKTYRGAPVLADLDLVVAPGAFFGLFGPNGSGRSTLLEILATLVGPSSGGAEIAGFDLVKQPFSIRQRIGYVPDTPSFPEALSVAEYLGFLAAARKLVSSRRTAAIDEALGRTGLPPDARIRRLSRGMRQRLAVAGALLHGPSVVLLDDPLSGLDPAMQQSCRAWFGQLRHQGTTFVAAVNSFEEVRDLCTAAAVLRGGRLVEVIDGAAIHARLPALLAELAGGAVEDEARWSAVRT